jgi:hypothetical protein
VNLMRAADGVMRAEVRGVRAAVTMVRAAVNAMRAADGVMRASVTAVRAAVTMVRAAVNAIRAAYGVMRASVTMVRAAVTMVRAADGVMRASVTAVRAAVSAPHPLQNMLIYKGGRMPPPGFEPTRRIVNGLRSCCSREVAWVAWFDLFGATCATRPEKSSEIVQS